MKFTERVLLTAAVAGAVGVGVSYLQGKRGTEMFSAETLGVAALAFLGTNVAWTVVVKDDASLPSPMELLSRTNPAFDAILNAGMGNMSSQAVKLLSGIDPELLYAPFKKRGVTVDLAPKNPFVIQQD